MELPNPVKTTALRDSSRRVSLREQYLWEKARIQQEIGDLEQIRLSLGLSQRKMCQLLLVDPSAWTRWSKTPGGAPPHIYQALRWLLELKKINPDAVVPNQIADRVDLIQSSVATKLRDFELLHQAQENRLVKEILALKTQLALLLAERQQDARRSPPAKSRRPKVKTPKKRVKKRAAFKSLGKQKRKKSLVQKSTKPRVVVSRKHKKTPQKRRK